MYLLIKLSAYRESLGKPEQVMFVLGIAVVIDSSNYTNHKQMKVIKGHVYRLTKASSDTDIKAQHCKIMPLLYSTTS